MIRVRMGEAKRVAYAFLRGGNWNNASDAGAFALDLNNTPGNQNNNIGFRYASDERMGRQTPKLRRMCGACLQMRIPDDPNDHKVLSVARLGMYRRLPCRNIRFPRVGGKHKARILVLLSYYMLDSRALFTVSHRFSG